MPAFPRRWPSQGAGLPKAMVCREAMAFQRRWSSKFQRKLRTGPAYSVTMPRKALKARVVALVSLILCAVFGASVGVTSHSGLCKGADQQCVDGNTVPSSPARTTLTCQLQQMLLVVSSPFLARAPSLFFTL